MRVRVTAAWVLAGVLLVACGTPEGPVAIPPDEIPFDPRRFVSPTPAEPATASYRIFFERRGRLVEVERDLATNVPGAEAVVRALLEGPTRRERDRRIRTEIPNQTRLLRLTVVEGIAEVDLSREFQTPAPQVQILVRVAQVVFSLVAVPGITAVRFATDGQPISVVTQRGTAVSRPVTAPDYSSVAPA